MKVIFVGMHNKVDKIPLCSSTKSGKLIDRIISGVKPIQCLKTNLYDIDYYPKSNDEKRELAIGWLSRIDAQNNDIIVLLGAEVHANFIPNLFYKIIKIAHPSSKRSHEAMNDYVTKTVKILNVETLESGK